MTCRVERGGPVLISFFGGLGQVAAPDYIDIDALLQQGIDLPTVLAAGMVVYGARFNPLITLKALSYFDDLHALPTEVRRRLIEAVKGVDATRLPTLVPYLTHSEKGTPL